MQLLFQIIIVKPVYEKLMVCINFADKILTFDGFNLTYEIRFDLRSQRLIFQKVVHLTKDKKIDLLHLKIGASQHTFSI